MAAALRFAARKVSRGALQQATAFVSPSPAVKEEQRRLLPEHQTIASCKEPASLRAQIEEKKHELFHLLFELKYGRKSIAGGEKLSIQDERILGELTPYRELKAMADKYGLKQALKYIGITYVLGFAVLGMAVNHM
ncbi:Os05g0229300 [Oryza sativa Japonica Group]|uniref:Os05g0229300 protein n=1 Tax=Oryza sativa subsp. japonica TaxID=39947 RepID=Q75IF6_ORYSJ|nr:hypothetical protein [Oryza sativa Japonica Group]AAT93840.1 hypothetical protein [Oryza sativa Japonica Group]BAF16888.1 Os05g0229300 [Oryza sativa Japonica Group]|eukprot:NP_001054974.1 Os05g0229300 [Oryza sativa Japonica Group]